MDNRCKENRGFTLIELTIALIVFLIGVLGLLQLLVLSVSINQRSRDTTIATTLAQGMTDNLLSKNFTDTKLNLGGNTPTSPNSNPLKSPNSPPVAGYVDFFDFNGKQLAMTATTTGQPQPVPAGSYFVRQWLVEGCDGSCSGGTSIPDTCLSSCSPSGLVLKKITVTVSALNPIFRGSIPSATMIVYKTKVP